MNKKSVGHEWKFYLFGFIMNLSGFIFGYTIGMFNNFFPYFIQGMFPKSKVSSYNFIKSMLNTSFNAGGFFCTLTSTFLMKYFGRRTLFFSSALVFIVLNIVQVYLPLNGLYVIRFFIGYISCFYSILSTVTISETIPKEYVGGINATFYAILTIGVQAAFFVNGDWAAKHYKLVFWFPILIELIRTVLFLSFTNIETPRHIFSDICKKFYSLSEGAGTKNNENELNLLDSEGKDTLRMKFANDPRTKKYLNVFFEESVHDQIIDELKTEYLLQNQIGGKKQSIFKTAFSRDYIKQTFLGFLLNLANQLTGINVIIFFSSNIFLKLGFSDPGFLTILVNLFNVAGGFTNVFAANRLGRKRMLSFGLMMITISYILNMIANIFFIKFLVPFATCMFLYFFATSTGGILYVYQVEILPGEIIPLVSNSQWIFTLIISYFTLPLINLVGIYSLYCFFFLYSFITWFLFEGYACQTENKTLSEVKDAFLKKRFWNLDIK